MSVTAPPRPPRQGDPVDRDELEALVEALIEEARQRARRRRRIYTAVASAVVFGGVVVITVFERAAQSQTDSPAPAAQTGAPGVAGSARIAFTRSTGPMSGDVKELYVMNADGSGQRRLTRITSFGLPAWSPDGLRLALRVRRLPQRRHLRREQRRERAAAADAQLGVRILSRLVAGRADDRLRQTGRWPVRDERRRQRSEEADAHHGARRLPCLVSGRAAARLLQLRTATARR